MLKILPVLIILAGIVVGVYIVQKPTSILPQAQEILTTCKNNPIPPPKTGAGENFKYFWQADCQLEEGQICKINSDCPQNTTDPNVDPQTSNWCYGFVEGPRCMQLVTKRKQTPTEKRLAKMQDYQKGLAKFESIDNSDVKMVVDRAKTILEDGIVKATACLNDPSDECKDSVKEIYGSAKASYRLVKYYSILVQHPSTCVEADLGMQPRLLGTSIDQYQEKRRLFMCSGTQGSLKWRVKSKDESKLIRTLEEFSLSLDNLPNSSQLISAKEKVGL